MSRGESRAIEPARFEAVACAVLPWKSTSSPRRLRGGGSFQTRFKAPLGFAVVWLALFGCGVCSVWAHQLSDSFLVLEVTNSKIIGHWDIALKDLLHARGVDPLTVQSGDLRSWDPEDELKKANVLSRLNLRLDGASVQIQPVDYSMEVYNDGPYAALYFELPLPTNSRVLEVTYRLFFDVDPAHRGLLRLLARQRTVSAVFTPSRATQQFDLATGRAGARLLDFIRLGVWHIWTGIDHLLFLLALLLPSVWRWKDGQWEAHSNFRSTLITVLKIVTAFTLAHSITLSLAALNVVRLNPRLVETIVALSVAFAALNNVFALLPDFGWIIAFCFGLVHGFAFATVLSDLGLQRGNLAAPLIGFNAGVELGQLGVVALFLPVAFKLRSLPIYRVAVFKFGSILITALAAVWACERLFDLKLLPF